MLMHHGSIDDFRYDRERNRINRFINDKVWDTDTQEYQDQMKIKVKEIEDEIQTLTNSPGNDAGKRLFELKLKKTELEWIANRHIPESESEAKAMIMDLDQEYLKS